MPLADPAAVAGLPESRLSAADLAGLPAAAPPAPWTCRARATLWAQRAEPPAFGWEHGRRLPLAAVAFVDYLDTPVGPYREVLAAATLLRGARPVGQVPFIAVDSLPSVLGGRANWALPKTTATFGGDAGTGTADAKGDGWEVRVAAGRLGRAFPLRLAFTSAGPLGDYVTRLRATARPAVLRSSVRGGTLGGWLGSGRHAGLVLEGTFSITAPSGTAPR